MHFVAHASQVELGIAVGAAQLGSAHFAMTAPPMEISSLVDGTVDSLLGAVPDAHDGPMNIDAGFMELNASLDTSQVSMSSLGPSISDLCEIISGQL